MTVKWSAFAPGATITGSDITVGLQGGVNVQWTWTQVATYVAGLSANLTVGSSTITGGTSTRILYDNAGVVGEYTLTGSGTVAVMQNTPTLTTPVIGAATGTSAVLTNQIWSGTVSTALSSLTGSTDGFRSSAANVTQFGAENTTASSATQGGFFGLYSNDGAAMASGDRLGGVRAGGSSSASALRNAALIGAFADQAWVDASAYGSRWEFQTTTNGATSATTKLILGNSGLLSFGATAASTVPALGASGTSLVLQVGDGTLQTPITSVAAATLQFGAIDVDTAPIAQMLRTQGTLAGGTSNVAGANFTLGISPGKGTGAGGSFIVQVASAGSTGTAVNALATALTIDSTKLATFAGTILGGVIQGTTLSLNGATNTALLTSDAANIIAHRNGTTAQIFRLYEDSESANSIYSRAIIDAGSSAAGVLIFGSEHSGTTTSGTNLTKMQFNVDGVNKLDYGVTTAGNWAWTENSPNFNLISNAASGNAGFILKNAGNNTGYFKMYGSTSGVGSPLQNSAGLGSDTALGIFTDGASASGGTHHIYMMPGGYQNVIATFLSTGLVAFGSGITSSFPALKRSNANLIVVGADGSAAGGLTCSGPTGGLGYSTGAGGAVTQATNKSTGVTLNTICGQITMNSAALLAAAGVGFTLTNSAIAATDVIYVSIASGATADSYATEVDAVAAGSCRISLHNLQAVSTLSEAVVLNFVVIKGVTS